VTARKLVCFRTAGGIGRHPIEAGADPWPILARLAALVPAPAEWWVEDEQPRGGPDRGEELPA